MKCFVFFTFLFTLFCQTVLSQSKASIQNPNTSLAYIENKGQWDNKVTCLARAKNIDNWILSDGGILLDFYKIIKSKSDNKPSFKLTESTKFDSINGHRIHLNWLKSNTNLVFYKTKKHTEYYNYLVGKDISKHASNVALYDELYAKNLYQGIDIRYYCTNNSIRYDLIVKPNANTNQIKLQLDGVTNIDKDEKGNVIMHTNIGEISMQDLFVYEKETNKQIECKWVIDRNNELRLSIGQYNKSNTLIIDPLIYSTFLGGALYDVSSDIAVNNVGEAFVTGSTVSVNFDFTLGAYQTSYSGMKDSYISKLNSTGTTLLFSTFIGGSLDDESKSIKIDNTGNSYITGYTYSNDFNTTIGSFQTVLGSITDCDVFVCKLNPTGNSLVYSTYIGGSLDDQGFALELDSQNNAYITGYTYSTIDYDVTIGAYQANSTINSNTEVFITKLNSTGSSLIYSTLLGGSYYEYGYAITIDGAKNAYVTGVTYSSDFDLTPGSLFGVLSGGATGTVFVTKINSTGTNIIYSAEMGGYSYDIGYGIVVDTIGNAYVTGSTWSVDYPITSGAFQTVHGDLGIRSDCFVTKLNATGNALLFSTFIGADWEDIAYDIIMDSVGNIYTTGTSSSFNYYTSPSAIQPYSTSLFLSEGDVIISKLSNTGTMLYSTYLGGSMGSDVAFGIAIDKNGSLYITGTTGSTDYPITTGVYQDFLPANNIDAFITKLEICIGTNFNIISNNLSCNGSKDGAAIINFTGNINGVTFDWLPLSVSSQSISGLSAGTYTAYLTDSSGCKSKHYVTITEPSPIIGAISGTSVICVGQTSTLTATGGNSFLWNNGATSDSIIVNPLTNTNYSVVVLNGSCSDTAYISVSVLPIPAVTILGNDSICVGQSINLTATGGGTYTWSTGSFSNSILVSPNINSTYSVLVSNGLCSNTAQIVVLVSPQITASITGVTALCSGQSTTLTAIGGTNYNWNIGNSSSTLSLTPLINIEYSVIASNAFGCSDTAYVNITVESIPTITITGNMVACASQPLYLSANSVGNLLWNTGETTPSITTTPTSNVTYIATASNNCGSAVDSISIIVNPLPDITVSNDTTILIDNSVNLFANGSIGVTYSWLPANIGCSTCSVNIVSPINTTTYAVTVTNTYGCSVTKNIVVNVENNFDVFIPDVFSPNGDGENDVLYVRGLGIKEILFKLYDRLGEKIFETNDVTKGWDGNYKGAVLNNAVFVYELIATMHDGSKISKHGDVTLIK